MKRNGKKGKKTLFINTWNSYCGNCGEGADPEEKSHKTVLSWGGQSSGCGIKWKYVSSDYAERGKGIGVLEAPEWCKRMRPDLEVVGYEDLGKEELEFHNINI